MQGNPFEGSPVRVYDNGLTHGPGIVVETPQEEVIVKVPLVGGLVNVIEPVTLYVFEAGMQAPGTAVKAVILQRILQFVVAVPPLWLNVMFVGIFEKFVITNI